MHIIFPLSKSPHSGGRIGPVKWQDWYQTAVVSRNLLRRYQKAGVSARILLLSAMQVAGEKAEVDLYLEALTELGVSDEDIEIIRECYETTEQIDRVSEIARAEGADVDIISTPFHFPRVQWLSRKLMSAHHRVAFGIPRPKEAVTDIVLDVAYPIIELVGAKKWFRRRIENRRKSGKF